MVHGHTDFTFSDYLNILLIIQNISDPEKTESASVNKPQTTQQ